MKHHAPGFLRLVEEAKQRVIEVQPEDLAASLPAHDVELIDVREDHEWAAGHITGARHLGKGILERDIEEHVPDKDREIILYCGGGYRSALAADALQQMGYRRVYSLSGGYRTWTERGLPVDNRDADALRDEKPLAGAGI